MYKCDNSIKLTKLQHDIPFRKFADLHNLCKSHFDGSYGDEMFNRVVEGTKLGLTEHAFLSFVYGYDMSNVDIIVLLTVQYILR